jgi:hypothetical protein
MRTAYVTFAIFGFGALALGPSYGETSSQGIDGSPSNAAFDKTVSHYPDDPQGLTGGGQNGEAVAKPEGARADGSHASDRVPEAGTVKAQQGQHLSRDRVNQRDDGIGPSPGRRADHFQKKTPYRNSAAPNRQARAGSAGVELTGSAGNARIRSGLPAPRGPFGASAGTPTRCRARTQAAISGTDVSNVTHSAAINGTQVQLKP